VFVPEAYPDVMPIVTEPTGHSLWLGIPRHLGITAIPPSGSNPLLVVCKALKATIDAKER
jgi:hypothetical protein